MKNRTWRKRLVEGLSVIPVSALCSYAVVTAPPAQAEQVHRGGITIPLDQSPYHAKPPEKPAVYSFKECPAFEKDSDRAEQGGKCMDEILNRAGRRGARNADRKESVRVPAAPKPPTRPYDPNMTQIFKFNGAPSL